MEVSLTITREEMEEVEKRIRNAATNRDYTGAWFDSQKEFEDWAGDVFWYLLDEAFHALDINIEDEE